MSTDAQGNTTLDLPAPYFRADMNNVDQTGVVPATYTKLLFPNVASNQGNFYDPVTSRWTPPAGNHILFLSVFLVGTNLIDQDQIIAVIGKDGALYVDSMVRTSAATATHAVRVTARAETDGTSYFEAYVYVAGGAGNKTVYGSPTSTQFTGVTVGQ